MPKNENIKIDERNPLEKSLKPHQIGFFTHFIVGADKTTIYEQCTSMNTTTKCPPFLYK
jgi:hypothetical protein